MTLPPTPSADTNPHIKNFEVQTNYGKHKVRALSPSVDEGGYLSFYRPGNTKAYDPVAGFPKGEWVSWRLLEDEPT